MRENRKRSWPTVTGISFLGRLKHRANQSRDMVKYFVNHFYPEPAAAAPPSVHAAASGQSRGASGYGQFDFNECSGSNHTSTQNSEYFDGIDGREYTQEHQIPGADWHGCSSRPSQVPASAGYHQQLPEMYIASQQLDQCDGMHQYLPTSHDQNFLRDFDRLLQEAPMSVDRYDISSASLAEISEEGWQRDESTNHNYSRGYGASSISIHEVSGDTRETMDSNVADTGDSKMAYILAPHPEPHHRSGHVIRGYINLARRILLDDDIDDIGRGRRFRVVANIVYVYRKLRMLVRKKKMQRCTSSQVSGEGSGFCKLKRIRSGECKYQGTKKRKDKWVAEIRVSKTMDKIWLGSFQTEKEAALAYDAGLHHCSVKRNKVFNFKETPKYLGPSQHSALLAMSKDGRKTYMQNLASQYAMEYGNNNTIR